MSESNKYWNYATVAAIAIGVCNALPNYMDYMMSTTAFSSTGTLWKMVTSFLILMFIGKRYSATQTEFSYGKSFKWSYLSCLLSSLVEGLLSILYIKALDPGYLDKTRNMVMQILEQNPAYTNEMMDTMNKSLNTFMSPSGILLSTIFSAAIFGAIMSLIAALPIRKKIDLSQDIDE